uniref:Uncharacterized protein n=1 Tax=Nelumbo nucifera TaxID=4432 RepID=A0A822YDG1_NELNU|nr:TPA_asm: hypothetical protein HUJ06_011035 [Nelumbo nucifera]
MMTTTHFQVGMGVKYRPEAETAVERWTPVMSNKSSNSNNHDINNHERKRQLTSDQIESLIRAELTGGDKAGTERMMRLSRSQT